MSFPFLPIFLTSVLVSTGTGIIFLFSSKNSDAFWIQYEQNVDNTLMFVVARK